MSSVEPNKLREFDTVEKASMDMKSLQAFIDMALRVLHIVDVNLQTMDDLSQALLKLRGRHPLTDATQIQSLLHSLSNNRRQHRFVLKSFSSMLDRAKSLSDQVSP